MSERAPHQAFRSLTSDEAAILDRLIEMTDISVRPTVSLSTAKARSMNDGGMGSIGFVYETSAPTIGSKEIVVAGASDVDGVHLSLALNVDSLGRVAELDVWKVDFSPLLKLPQPDNLVLERAA